MTDPSASTAGSFRVMAFRFAICCTPIASVIVTSAGSPSGMAATAKPIVAEISSPNGIRWRNRPMSIMRTAMPRMTSVSTLPNCASCFVSGVCSDPASPTSVWMRPISVAAPVAVTMPRPCPAETIVPENAIDARSPTPASSATGPVCFDDGTDSPVSAASSIRSWKLSMRRTSAGTLSPGARRTTSPGTRSAAGIVVHAPSRRACASAESMPRMPASAFSARPSCRNPMTALMIATAMITQKSSQSAMIALIAAAPSRM